jgi:hypothetical protein
LPPQSVVSCGRAETCICSAADARRPQLAAQCGRSRSRSATQRRPAAGRAGSCSLLQRRQIQISTPEPTQLGPPAPPRPPWRQHPLDCQAAAGALSRGELARPAQGQRLRLRAPPQMHLHAGLPHCAAAAPAPAASPLLQRAATAAPRRSRHGSNLAHSRRRSRSVHEARRGGWRLHGRAVLRLRCCSSGSAPRSLLHACACPSSSSSAAFGPAAAPRMEAQDGSARRIASHAGGRGGHIEGAAHACHGCSCACACSLQLPAAAAGA